MTNAYVYWQANRNVTVTFEPSYEDLRNGDNFNAMRLTALPVSVRFFMDSGLRMGLTVTGVEQDGEFEGFAGNTPGSDRFLLLDAIASYRLPGRRGTLSLEGRNLLDEEFHFQEIDVTVRPRYVPEAQLFLTVTLSF